MKHTLWTATLSWVLLLPGDGLSQCIGDCDGNGEVNVAELTQAVRIALLKARVDECSACDPDDDGKVVVSELVAAVDAALSMCTHRAIPTATATPSPADILRPSETPTTRPTVSRDSELGQAFIEAARRSCGASGITLFEGVYAFNCSGLRGHSLTFSVRVLNDNDDAVAAFESSVPDDTDEAEFCGNRAAHWDTPDALGQDYRRDFVWVTDCVLVLSTKVDDTSVVVNPSLENVSTSMKEWIGEYALPQCN